MRFYLTHLCPSIVTFNLLMTSPISVMLSFFFFCSFNPETVVAVVYNELHELFVAANHSNIDGQDYTR